MTQSAVKSVNSAEVCGNGSLGKVKINGVVESSFPSTEVEKRKGAAERNGSITRKGSRRSHSQAPPKRNELTPLYGVDWYEEAPYYAVFFTYVCYGMLVIVGYIREAMARFGVIPRQEPPDPRGKEEYVSLYASFESFYTRNVYRRIRDCWNRPIIGVPGAYVTLKDRETKDNGWTFEWTGKTKDCINLGSYNYLGFSENRGPCAEASKEAVKVWGGGTASSREELGTTTLLKELEKTVAEYLGTEDAVTFGMGFATNSLNIPGLVDKQDLVISDEYNHASLILGMRLSGASVRVFRHNNMTDLERVLREAIVHGHPRTRRPWQKILIIVEGVYSMEGSIVKLPEVIELKKRYKAYLYLDEAHSIGAVGPHGKGVVDYFGLNPRDVDVMMGTFTKSFGSAGGYIAGSKALVDHMRAVSHGNCYASAMSAPVAQQILSVVRIIIGRDHPGEGERRMRRLLANSRYFRRRLKQKKFIISGDDDSPVVPLMLYSPSKIAGLVRLLTLEGVATVGVGFPATRLSESRARFCCSAAHTKEMLDETIDAVDKVGEFLGVKYSRIPKSEEQVAYEFDDVFDATAAH